MGETAQASSAPVVILGAGQAGFAAASKLRDLGHDGPITLVGEESHPPYQRPPLSKAYLFGEMSLDRMLFRPQVSYAERGIDLRLGQGAVRILRGKRQVALSDGTLLPYGHLVLATGAAPRRLPAAIGGDLGSVFTVRSLDDADAMRRMFQPGQHLLVVGGGYVGLEAAASAVKLGLEVTLIEAAGRILQRVAAPETSEFFRILHRSHGVDLREGCGLVRLTGNGTVQGAELSDGTRLKVDAVVVGIGVTPNTALAQEAGLEVANGIRVDTLCRTSDPAILAAGDCDSFPHHGAEIRLESVGNAIDQGEAVARSIVGQIVPYVAKPWFWSDQYEVKLQIAGLSSGYDHVVTRPATTGTSFWYFREGRLLAVDAMNEPKIYMIAKRLLDAGAGLSPDEALLPEADLRVLMSDRTRPGTGGKP